MSRLTCSCLLILFVCPFVFADDSKPDLLPVQSHWSGTQLHDPAHGESHDRAATLDVMDRDGEKFTIHFWVVGPENRKGVELQGTVAPDGVITAHATRILKSRGTWERSILDETFTGQATAEKVTLHWNMPSNGGSHEAAFTLDEPKHRKKKHST